MTSHGFSLRYSAGERAQDYPFPTQSGLTWRRSQGLWTAEIDLPVVDAGSLITPSLSLLNNWPYDYQFELIRGNDLWPLPRVPSESGAKAPKGSNDAVQGQLDCWQVRDQLEGARLRVCCAAADAPEAYLLSITCRPRELAAMPSPPAVNVRTERPATFSQMLENPRHASRICSPVSLAMILAQSSRVPAPLHQLLPLCFDQATRMYGMWPLAIRAASRFGVIGAVELLSDWSMVLTCLAQQRPVVASIRYAQGALQGAPQAASHGHLVVVYGIDDSQVLVNDPAAPDRGSVSRRYNINEFSEAWFRHRGAAYILAP